MKAILFTAVLLAAAAAMVHAQSKATLTVEYDNRGKKAMDQSTNAKVVAALARDVFLVAPGNVKMVGGLGQSSTFNHKSTVSYQATGPTTNGKSVLQNCKDNTKGRLFGDSKAANSIKKATDTWAPGDSLKLKAATCTGN